MRTLDIAILELFAVIQLLAVEDQTDLYNVDALLLLELVFEPKNLVPVERFEQARRSKKTFGKTEKSEERRLHEENFSQTVSSSSTLNSLFLPVNVLTKICMAFENVLVKGLANARQGGRRGKFVAGNDGIHYVSAARFLCRTPAT